MSVSRSRRFTGECSIARESKAPGQRIRKGLLCSTALVAASLAASGAMAQTAVVNPTGGGTITRIGGSNPVVENQTPIGNGLRLSSVTQSTALTVNGVTINQAALGPTLNALDIRGSTSGLNSTGVAFDGVNTLTTNVSDGAAYFQQTNANQGMTFLSSGSTFTGSYGVNMQTPSGYVDFNSAGQGQSFIANGTAIAGLNAISAINNNLQLGTSTFTGFATGVNATNFYGSSLTSTGGSINATTTGIRLDATGGGSTVNSQTAITAPTGIDSTNTNGTTITTSGGGTINSTSNGVGTGIQVSSSGGSNAVNVNVGAAIGGVTRHAIGVSASTSGSSMGAINITTTAEIQATSRGLSLSQVSGNTATVTIGADITAATAVYSNVGTANVTVGAGVGITGTGSNEAAVYLVNGAVSVNNSGTITHAGTSLASGGVYFSNSSSSLTNTASGSITGLNGAYFQNGSVTTTNAGSITGTGTTAGTAGLRYLGGTVNNTGSITGGYDGIFNSGNPLAVNNTGGSISGTVNGVRLTGSRLTLANSATIQTIGGTAGAGGAGVLLNATLDGHTITNSGVLTGGSNATDGFGIRALNGGLTITNASGGTIAGGIGAISIATDDAATIDLQAGSTTTGDVVLSSTGARTVTIAGAFNGNLDATGNSGVVNLTLNTSATGYGLLRGGTGADSLTLAGTGSRTLNLDNLDSWNTGAFTGGAWTLSGAGNGTSFGSGLSISGGSTVTIGNTLQLQGATGLSMTTGGSLMASASLTNARTLTLTGAGGLGAASGQTLTQSGLISGSGSLSIGGLGTTILSGANTYTGGTIVNSGIMQLGTTTAAGTGTIRMIDPQINFAATGTYANAISLEVADGQQAADPTILNNISGGDITLAGRIYETAGVGGSGQYVTFAGAGSTTLTNTTNSWAGVTTVNSGVTLIGTSQTISGGSIVGNGSLNYVQASSGTVNQAISGSGQINVSGLGAGQALTFAGNLTNANGIDILDGSAIVIAGNMTTTNGPAIFSNAAGISVTNLGAMSANAGSPFGTINLGQGGTVINGSVSNSTASISGGYAAIYNTGGALNVTNYGSLINAAYGIVAQGGNGANPTSLTLVNSGTIRGSDQAVVANDQTTTNSTTNTATGLIQGNNVGLILRGNAIANNSGDIVGGTTGVVLFNASTNSLTNSGRIASGTIAGNVQGGVITVSGGSAVELAGGTVNNLAGGQILGNTAGINSSAGTLSVTNAGTITSNGTTAGTAGIVTAAGGSVTNQAGGQITGAIGVRSTGGTLALTNFGIVTGASALLAGVNVAGAGSVLTNHGTIQGGAQAIVLNNGGTVYNYGASSVLRATNTAALTDASGIYSNGALTLTNEGAISTASTGVSHGVQVLGAATITNTGTITAASASGIAFTGGGSSIVNSGTITGGNSATFGYGVQNSAASGLSTITNQSGGVIGGGTGSILLNGAGNTDINLQAGSTTNGQILSTAGGTHNVVIAGVLNGAYNAATGSGIDNLTLAATGSMTSANLGAGDDIFTYQGGTFSGLIDGGSGTDSFISALGLGNTAAINQANLTNFEFYIQQSGGLTLNGARTSGAAWTVAGGSLTLAGSLSGLNATHVNVTGAGATFNNADGATVAGGNYMGVRVSGAGGTVNNLGSITNSGTGADGTIGAAVYVSTTTGVTTINNGSPTDTGAGSLIQGRNAGIRHQGGSDTLVVNNYGHIIGDLYNGIENSVGGLTVNNFAGGLIRGADTGITGAGVMTITNAGTMSGVNGSSNGIASSGTLTLVNQNGGQITGGASGSAILSSGANASITNESGGRLNGFYGITTSGAGAVINNSGLIRGVNDAIILGGATALTNNAGGLIVGGGNEGVFVNATGSTINNAGLIVNSLSGIGANSYIGSIINSGIIANGTAVDGAISLAGITRGSNGAGIALGAGGHVTNLAGGQILGGFGVLINNGATGSVTNSGVINANGAGQTAYAVSLTGANSTLSNLAGGAISSNNGDAVRSTGANAVLTNAGSISGGAFGLNLSGGGTITNQSGGSITGTTGAINLTGASNYTLNLEAGSTTGAITSTATGSNQVFLRGTLSGGYTGGTGVDNINIYTTASGNFSLDGGAGTSDAVNFESSGDSTRSGSITNFEIARFNGTGTVTLTGTNTGLQDFFVNSGTVSVSSAANMGGATGMVGLLGGTLQTTASFDSNRTYWTANNFGQPGRIDVGAGTTFGIAGGLQGNGDLMVLGAGTLNLLTMNSGFSGDIHVNGSALRAGAAGAFGTGTIHLINPTLIYGASGTYANNILLEVQSPATGDPSTLRTDAGVTATLSGSITQGTGAGVDPIQPLVIDGLGRIVLTNTANLWAGTTTINAGATLQGATDTISGSSTIANGVLHLLQPTSGTFARNVSGGGNVQISGLNAGQTLTLSGALTNSNGLQVLDGSALVLTGSVAATGTAVTLNSTNLAGVTNALNNSGSIGGVFAINAVRNLDLTNSGTISASITNFNNSGIYVGGTGTISNSGSITSGTNAIYTQGLGSVTNSGLIRAGGAASTIRLVGAGSSVTNLAGGQITTTGTGVGVYLDGINGSVINAGAISGGNAISLVSGGSVVNSGTLTSTGGSSVVFQATGSVDNQASGSITGATNGVTYTAGSATVTNAGSITGSNGSGLRLLGGGTVTNAATGQITGTGNAAILAQGGALNLVSHGSLVGTTGLAIVTTGAFDNVIDLQAGSSTNGSVATDTGADTLTVAGMITGTVDLGAGDDRFTLVSGGSVSGLIDGGAGTDAFILGGSGDATFNVAQAVNFETRAMNGTGTWTLTGTDASSAGWALNSGVLAASGGSAIHDAAGVTIAGGATLALLNDETIGSLAGSGFVNLGASRLTLAGAQTTAYAGVISGVGGLTVGSAYGLTLSGANTYTGTTVVDGVLTLGAAGVLADGSNLLVNTAGVVDLQGFDETVNNAFINGILNGTGTLTAGQYQLTGATVDANLGAGDLIQVSGVSTLNGTSGSQLVSVAGGTLALGASDRLSDTATVVVANGAVLNLNAFNDTIGLLGLAGTLNGTGTLTAGRYELTGAAVNANLGAGDLIQVSGVSTLNGTSGSQLVSVAGGTLALGASDRLSDTATVVVASGSTLNLGAFNDTVNLALLNGTLAGTGTLSASQYQLNGATVNANLGAGDLIQVSGLSTLNGTSGSQLVSVAGGTLGLGASDRLSDTATVVVASGSTLNLGVFNDTVNLALLNGTLAGTGTLSASQYQLNGATVNANLGAGDLIQVSGLSTLNGTSGSQLVSVAGGTLGLGASDRLSDTSTVVVASGSTLNLGAFNDTVNLALLNGTLAGTGTLTASQYQLNGATVNANLGTGDLFNAGGVSTLNGTSGSQLVSIAGGVLGLGASDRLSDTATVVVANEATLNLNAFNDTVGLLGLAGTLNGTGTLTAGQYQLTGATVNANLGAGDLIQVSGLSTLNGTAGAANVVVQAGTLTLGASDRLADTATVSVASGGTLDLGAFNDTVNLALLNGTLAGTGTLTASQYQLDGATVNANLGEGTLFNLGGVSTLNGTVGATDVSLNAGTLRLGASERLSDTATVFVATGATFALNGFNERIGALFGTGDVDVGAGRLTFGGSESAFGGRLSGAGSLVHTSGLFTLMGDHTIASISNTGGELRFLGATTGAIAVTGGSLTGAGTIGGALTASNGAVLSPGVAGFQNGIGGFTAGGLTLNGATLAIDVLGRSGGHLIDQLRINGTATLTGGLLTPTLQGGASDFDFSTRYLFLQANNLVGTFANGASFTAAAREGQFWRVRYDLSPNAAVLELRELTNFDPGVTGTGNQRAIGRALSEGQLEASDDFAGILGLVASLNDADRIAAFDSISGEPLANMTTSLFSANGSFLTAVRDGGLARDGGGGALNFVARTSFSGGRESVADRVGAVIGAFDPSASTARGAGGWVAAHAADQTLEGKPGTADVDTRLNGFAGGYGIRNGSISVGAAGGVTRLEGDVFGRQARYESDLSHAAAYVAFDDGVWAADVTASIYGGGVDSRRGIRVGTFEGQAIGDTHAEGQSISASVARRFQVSDDTMVALGAIGTASNASVDGFTETGAGGLSLEASGLERDWQSLQISARGIQDYRVDGRRFRIYAGAGVMATTGDRDATGAMRFSGAATGFGAFTVEGAETPPLAGLADFGLEVGVGEGLTLSAGYRGLFSERLRDNQVGIKLRANW